MQMNCCDLILWKKKMFKQNYHSTKRTIDLGKVVNTQYGVIVYKDYVCVQLMITDNARHEWIILHSKLKYSIFALTDADLK